MSTFETALKFGGCPLSGGGPRRLPHLPHSKSAPDAQRNLILKNKKKV